MANWFSKFFTRSVPITNTDGMFRLVGSRPSASGIRVSETTALSAPAFYRAIDLISDRIAGLDCNLYRRVEGEGKEKAKNLPAYHLMRDACNPYQSAHCLKKTIQKDRLVHGNGYIWVQRDQFANPTALYRLDPLLTFPVVEGGVVLYGTIIDNEPRKLLAENLVHIKGLGDGLVGYSIIEILRDVIGSNVQANRYTANFFKNGARPTYAIKLPAGLREEDKKRFREDWKNIHSGVEGNLVAALLPHGFEIDTFGFNLEEIELTEIKQFSLVDFANIVGIPASYLGSSQNTSYSSLESEAKSFLANSLNGHLQAWTAELNMKMRSERMKSTDSHFWDFDRKQLEQTDLDKLSQALNKQKEVGAISTNEYRKAINLPPIKEPWADEYVMPQNLAFIDQMRAKFDKEMEKLDQPETQPQVVVEPEPKEEEKDDRLEKLTRSTLDRLGTRLQKAIERKGTHDLIQTHLAVFTESLEPLNERAEQICQEYLERVQEELEVALPEQMQIDTKELLEKLL